MSSTSVCRCEFVPSNIQRVLWHELSEGIGIQFFGWLVSEKPWTGASDDGTYHSDAGYMDEQKKFQESDKVDGEVIKFRNILDRGYRGNDAAHLMDQLCLQPPQQKVTGDLEERNQYMPALLLVIGLEMNEV